MKNIFDKWRLFKEVLASDSGESEYEKAISSAETAAGLDPEAQKAAAAEKPKQKTSTSGTIKSSCNCVDSSESGLSVEEIKKLINKYYTEKNPDPSFKKLNVDNDCNLETQKAIMQFQADTGAEQDGCVGDETEGKMVEAGLIDKPTSPQSYSAAGAAAGAAATSAGAPISAAVAGATGGVTIAIKASTKGPAPHRIVGANYHGYGRDSHDVSRKGKAQTPNTSNDAYIINPVWFGDVITSSHIAMRKISKRRQYGHPDLAKIISAAADKTAPPEVKPARDGGVALISGVSLGGPSFPCYNQKDIDKNPNIPCVQGGWGVGTKATKGNVNQTGGHRFGHQSGLEADVSYYRNSGLGSKYWKVPGRWKEFDYERNLAFAEALLGNNQIELVLIGKDMVNPLKKWIENNNRQEQFPKAYASLKSRSSGKLKGDSTGGHNDHFHIRMKFPNNSYQSLAQFKKKTQNNVAQLSTSKETTSSSGVVVAVQQRMSSIREQPGTLDQKIRLMHKELMKLSLGDLQKMYGDKFGYALGLVTNSEPSVTYNHNKVFYGASSPKTMAGLAQLIKYVDDPARRLNMKELRALLTYKKHAGKNSGSNGTNRAISMTHRNRGRATAGRYVPYKRRAGTELGLVSPEDVKKVSKAFGITRSGFLWGRRNNKQSPRDMFKFFSGLQRMTTNKSKGEERQFYNKYQKEVDSIVNVQKERRHSPRVSLSGVTKRNHWGKGGRAMHAVSHTFIVDGKYALSVYVDLGDKYGKQQGGDHEGYAVLNTVLAKLLEKT